MSVAIVVAVLIMISGAFAFLHRSARRREAERAEEYRKAAALRGWQLELDGSEYRYSGTTEGVPWTARIGHFRRSVNETPKPLRWETTAVRLDEGALVVWPDFGQGMEAIRTPNVPHLVLDLAMRAVAQAIGVPSGGVLLADAVTAVDGPAGYLFRATDANRMRDWLAGGAARALEAEADWLASQQTPHHLIIAVLWRHGLHIATAYGSNDLEHLARVARVGARLAGAARA